MRIVIDARESGTSTGRYTDNLIKYLHKIAPKEYEFIVLTKPKRLDAVKKLAPNFIVQQTPYTEFSFGEQLGFKKQLEELKPHLVHFGMVQQPVFYKGKTVTTMMDLTTTRFKNPAKNSVVFWFKQIVYRWVNKRVAKKASQLLTISEFSKQDIAKFAHIDPNKFTVTYPAADAITDKAEPVVAVKDKPFIMYVGRPQPHKNLQRFMDSFDLLRQGRPDLHLVLAGKLDDNYRLLQKYAEEQNISQVVFTDFVSEGQLRWLYEHAQAYVLPSLAEGFGLPGLEAMIQGCPVVSSNAACLPEVYEGAAVYFDPTNIKDMTEKIDQVLADEELRDELIKKGYNQVKKFSWARMAEQTLAVYKDALNS